MGVREWEEEGIYFGENGGKDAKWLVLKLPRREINPKCLSQMTDMSGSRYFVSSAKGNTAKGAGNTSQVPPFLRR